MRYLLENGSYSLTNHGDVAMLQAMYRRIKKLDTNAVIEIPTSNPRLLELFCPGAIPLVVPSLKTRLQMLGLGEKPLEWLAQNARAIERRVQSILPVSASSIGDKSRWEGYQEAVSRADLVMTNGGGYINDTFLAEALGRLETLHEAINMNKKTAILGHGFEPMTVPALVSKGEQVFPYVDVISCREHFASPDVLAGFGVLPDRVTVTGDDAIEMAYSQGPDTFGRAIGINIRVAWYSGIKDQVTQELRDVLQSAARRYNSKLIPIPISLKNPSDPESIQLLLTGFDNKSDGGMSLITPDDVIQAAGQCRMVITGSYHGGVFALSQGVSVIGLVKSQYYVNKFKGLQGQFPDGCHIVSLDTPNLSQVLSDKIEEVWTAAPQAYPALLKSAERQIELGHQVYKQVIEMAQGATVA